MRYHDASKCKECFSGHQTCIAPNAETNEWKHYQYVINLRFDRA